MTGFRRMHGLAAESGSVLVMVAVMLAVLLLFVSFVADVGNWFQHKRHLQLQADAAALAAGDAFKLSACSDTAVNDVAHRYGGDQTYTAALGLNAYNRQTGGTSSSDIGLLINSRTFWGQPSGPTDTDIPDATWLDHPCAHKMVDVKVTERNLPLFLLTAFTPFKKIAHINAHARVQILQQTSSRGSLPVAVPDPRPVSAAAIVVNEETSPPTVLDAKKLTLIGPATLNGRTMNQWDNTSAPLSVNVQARTGVVIALSGTTTWSVAGMTLSQICNQTLVECYEGGTGGPWVGLDFIQGYSTAGTGTQTAPLLRDVRLLNQSCTDGSGAYFILNGGCTIGFRVKIDFGLGASPPPAAYQVAVEGPASCPNSGQPKGCPLTFNAGTGYWESTIATPSSFATIPSNAGAIPLTVNWKTGSGGPNSGSFANVQRTYSAAAGSGPVQFVTVSDSVSGVQANALTLGTHTLTVGIGVMGNLGANATSGSDPVVSLRVVGGSLNQSLDCDPSPGHSLGPNDPTYTTLWEELAYGCYPEYVKNTGATACPASPTTLWDTGQPPGWQCVAVQTGGATNQVPKGMNQRVYGNTNPPNGSCPPLGSPGHNNWSMFPNFLDTDPRIIEVFIVPFGSFSGSGSTTVPVTGFATFYVTGWNGQGSGFDNPCQGFGDDAALNGYIVGHFIAYKDTINNGGGSGDCDPTVLGRCIAVLTR